MKNIAFDNIKEDIRKAYDEYVSSKVSYKKKLDDAFIDVIKENFDKAKILEYCGEELTRYYLVFPAEDGFYVPNEDGHGGSYHLMGMSFDDADGIILYDGEDGDEIEFSSYSEHNRFLIFEQLLEYLDKRDTENEE